MKRVIRRSVFETNSSSVHSISITNSDIKKSNLEVNDDGYIVVLPGEFGWGIENHRDQSTKLEYLVMMALETEGKKCETLEQFYKTKGFKLINTNISSYCSCKGIVLEGFNFEKHTYKDSKNEDRSYITHEGYIDHQSCDDYHSLKDFLDSYKTNVIDFVFNSGINLHISNDNI